MRFHYFCRQVCIFWLFLSLKKLAHCQQRCPENNYIIDDHGAVSCLLCNNCPEGHGLSPPCGSKLKHRPNISCVPCTPRKNYSDEYGPSSCKSCHLCSPNEIVNKRCTTTTNTICSNTCVKGYYYDAPTHECQACSQCCGDGEDVRMKECKEHGMPSMKRCSVHDSQRCEAFTPRSSTDVHYTTGPATESFLDSAGGITLIVVVTAVTLIVIAILIFAVVRSWIKNHRSSKDNVDAEKLLTKPMNSGTAFDNGLINDNSGQKLGEKLFKDLSPEIKEQVEDMLAPDSVVGNWKDLGREYGMDQNKLDRLKTDKDCKNAAHNVLDYITSTHPETTVKEFCQKMEKIKQNQVVDLLKSEIFSQKEERQEQQQQQQQPASSREKNLGLEFEDSRQELLVRSITWPGVGKRNQLEIM